MMRFLVFQHIAVEHPGNFRDFMRADGIEWDTVELDTGEAIPSLSGYDALLVMGGPMDVWEESQHPWLVAEKAAIREAVVERQMPYLGICLGHQLLAVSLDGEAAPMHTPEVGLLDVQLEAAGHDDPLFAGLPNTVPSLQWHSVAVSKLPRDSVVLASSPACAVQSFRTGKHAYGLQYHLEMTADTVPEWGCVPAYRTALENTLGAGATANLQQAVAAQFPAFNANARQLYNNFIAIVQAAQTTTALP